MPKLPDSERRRLVQGILDRGGTKDDALTALSRAEGVQPQVQTQPIQEPISTQPGQPPLGIFDIPPRPTPEVMAKTLENNRITANRLDARMKQERIRNIGVIPSVAGGALFNTAKLAAAGAGVGNIITELYNKFTESPENQPTLAGGAARTVFNAATAGLGTALTNKMGVATGAGGTGVPIPVEPPPVSMAEPMAPVAPILRDIPNPTALAEIPPKVSKSVAVGLGQGLKDTVRNVTSKMSPEWIAKQELLKSLESEPALNKAANLVDIKPVVEKMRSIIPAGKATGDTAEDAARNYLNTKADELAAEAGPDLKLPLSRVNEYLTSLGRMGWKESGASLTRNAAKQIRGDFRAVEEEFINRVHGPESLKKLQELNQGIASRLGVTEEVKKFMTKSPKGMVDAIKTNPEAADALEAFDTRMKTGFLKSFQEYHDSVARVEATRKALAEANKLAQQSFSRGVRVVNAENKATVGAYGRVIRGQSKAFQEEVKAAESARSESIRVAQANYKEAVKAADKAKERALFGAKLLGHGTGAVGGFFFGSQLGLPGTRWMGLIMGGMLGDKISPAIAKGLLYGGKASKVVAPMISEGTRRIGSKSPEENP